MQFIDINLPNIIEARDNHYLFMRYIIKKKLNGTAFVEQTPPNMNHIRQIVNIGSLDQEVIRFLNDEHNLKKILIGNPDELDAIKSVFTEPSQISSIHKIINYKSWINLDNSAAYRRYNAYNLAEKLDIPTCVYCNRIYTKTIVTCSGKKITRPTFDHWFPKQKYPLLAVSFYNLIPSCSICNSGLKASTPFSLSTHFHPYYRNPDKNFEYTFSYDHKDYGKFCFKISTHNKFSKDSVAAFELEELYKAHEDEIADLRKIKDAYSENYIKILQDQILGSSVPLDKDEVYRLAFGVHFQEAMFNRRPLSKMKKDILIELGIIK